MRTECIVRGELICDLLRKHTVQPATDIDIDEFVALAMRIGRELVLFEFAFGLLGVRLRTHRHILACGHRQRASDKAGDTCNQHAAARSLGTGYADNEARGRQNAIVGAEHGRTQPADAIVLVALAMAPRGEVSMPRAHYLCDPA